MIVSFGMSFKERLINSRFFYRFFESVPGIISWAIIVFPFILSIFAPKIVAYFILIYTCYWAVLAFMFVFNSIRGYIAVEKWKKIDWVGKLKNEFPSEWRKYYYATIIPFCKETERVLIPTIDSIVNAEYPKERKILVLSSDFHEPGGKDIAKKLKARYKNDFKHIVITEHPQLNGEIIGKAANENWGGRLLYKKCKEWKIPPEYVLVTSNDADMSIPRHYISSCLYYLLKQDPEYRHTSILQPIPTDLKNIWETSSLISIRVVIGALWRAALCFMPHQLWVFAHYTMTLKMLKEIGFWDPDIIQEDIRTHSKALFRFGTLFRVIPIFCVVEGEPVIGKNFLHTLVLGYKQVRRWAWGACELSYMVNGLLKKTKASRFQTLVYILDYLRSHIDWVIVSYVPLVGSSILFLINPSFKVSTIGRNLPFILGRMLRATSILLIIFVFLEFKIFSKPPKSKSGVFMTMWRLARWVISPYTGVFLSSIPALEAQTRLILNKRLAYVVYRKR